METKIIKKEKAWIVLMVLAVFVVIVLIKSKESTSYHITSFKSNPPITFIGHDLSEIRPLHSSPYIEFTDSHGQRIHLNDSYSYYQLDTLTNK